jgi:ceramide glucosyltransferase
MLHFNWLFAAEGAGFPYFSALIFLLCLCTIGYYGVAIYAAVDFFFQSTSDRPEFQPSVSLLVPICGLDGGAYENLASLCQQDYPNYQIIFAVQDSQDSSIPIIQQISRDFPELDLQFVISDRTIGMNRKVSNLANAAIEAKYNTLVLVDSDIRVTPDYLKQVVQPLHDSTVGVVTCMYRSLTYGWLSGFEAISITTEFLPRILAARTLQGMGFALGATIVIRKSVLEEIGGFLAVADALEDDYQLGHLSAQAGYQVVLSDYIVDHVMASPRLVDFIHHQTRWARGNLFARPLGHLSLIFTYGTVISLLFLLITKGSLFGWFVLGVTWSIRLVMAWFIGVQQLQDTVARKFLWLVPLRDIISFGFWCYGFLGNTIRWRDRRFRLTTGGKLKADLPGEALADITVLTP